MNYLLAIILFITGILGGFAISVILDSYWGLTYTVVFSLVAAQFVWKAKEVQI